MKKPPNSCTFSDFNFSPDLFKLIKTAGYTVPTEVQCKAIPAILHNRDVLAGAETGSGKTAAFALPLLQKLHQQKQKDTYNSARGNHIRALILVPTRELAVQISETINTYAQTLLPRVKAVAVFGGVKINPQMMALRGGTDILVATPGRLLDLVAHNAIKFNKLHTLILDEVDRLVGEGFKEEIEEVFRLLPNQRQNLMFTATFPTTIRYLIRRLLKKPVIINIDPSQDVLIDQRVFTVNYDQKNALLAHLLNTYDWKQILIFCSVKRSCDNLVKKLEQRGITAVAMHSNKEQRARSKALREFKAGQTRVLIATDVAARGLDIEQLPCVINFELPRSPNDYTHRIGRTGRAGETGFAISLIAHHEYAHFAVIEKRSGVELKREQIEGFEADKIAPPAPTRQKPKKKARNKLSKKKRQRLLAKKQQQQYEASVAPQKISKHEDNEANATQAVGADNNKKSSIYTPKKTTTHAKKTYKQSPSSPQSNERLPTKKSVAPLGNKSPYNTRSNERLPTKKSVAPLGNKTSERLPTKKSVAPLGNKSPYSNHSNERLPTKKSLTPQSSRSQSTAATKNSRVWGQSDQSSDNNRTQSRSSYTKQSTTDKTVKDSYRNRAQPQSATKQSTAKKSASAWDKTEQPKSDKRANSHSDAKKSSANSTSTTQTKPAVATKQTTSAQAIQQQKPSTSKRSEKTPVKTPESAQTKTTGSNADIWSTVLKGK